MIVLPQPSGQLAGRSGFAGTLQSDKHNDRRWLRSKTKASVFSAQHIDKLVANDLDDLLRGAEALKHILPDGLDSDLVGELLHDLEVHIGFKQRHADFLQGLVDVLFGQAAFASEVLEGAL